MLNLFSLPIALVLNSLRIAIIAVMAECCGWVVFRRSEPCPRRASVAPKGRSYMVWRAWLFGMRDVSRIGQRSA